MLFAGDDPDQWLARPFGQVVVELTDHLIRSAVEDGRVPYLLLSAPYIAGAFSVLSAKVPFDAMG